MSYDVDLCDKEGQLLPYTETFQEGGTQIIGGHSNCSLNITFNYAEVFGGLVRDLNGKVAKDTLAELKAFSEKWKHAMPYERDYWAPTPGNAKKAIDRLISFAELHPEGVWSVW